MNRHGGTRHGSGRNLDPRWTSLAISKLGKIPDSTLAAEIGLSRPSVRQLRVKLKIKAFKRSVQNPKNVRIQLYATVAEYAVFERRATSEGFATVSAYGRSLCGFSAIRQGRPPKAAQSIGSS